MLNISICSVVFIACLYKLSSPLHLHSELLLFSGHDLMHFQTTTQDQSQINYVDTLKEDKRKFQSLLQNLVDFQQTNQKQIQQASNITQKISLYENLILNTNKKLALLKSQLNIPLNQSNFQCKSMTTQQKKSITTNISMLNDKLENLQSYSISSMKNSPQKQFLTQIINEMQEQNNLVLANTYANVQQKSTSPLVNNNTNLIDQQWLLGNQTIKDLNYNLKSQNQNLYGVSCPSETPYATSTNQCMKCPLSTPYFDLVLNKCISCSNVDQIKNVCLDNTNTNTNKTVANLTNFQIANDKLLVPPTKSINDYAPLSSSSNDRSCPQQTPFYDGKNCINCPYLFDLSTKTCTNCKATQKFNITAHTCQSQSQNTTNITPTTSNNTSRSFATNNNSYANVLIPTGQSFNQFVSDQAQKASQGNTSYCVSSTPYFNGSNCISCKQGQVFSISSFSCTTCQQSQLFNNITHHCENKKYYSDLSGQNWMSKLKTPQQILTDTNKNVNLIGSQKCPQTAPYFNSKTCIACSTSQYFSIDSLQCQSCPANLVFSKSTHKCEIFQGYYQTNPSTTSSLIYDGRSKNQWMHIYYSNIETNPQTEDCSISTPYFDGGSCINCQTQKPYFNLGTQVCQQCPTASSYNQNTHECLSDGKNVVSQAPTLEKMAAGIFS